MKTLQKNFVLILLFIGIQYMNAGTRNMNCLDVMITPTCHKMTLENCRVTFLEGNDTISALNKPNRGNRYKFSLKSNSYYTLIISCEGYHNRKISFDTSIPDSVKLAMLFEFCAKVEMIPLSVALSPDLDDFPIAIIRYDHSNDVFMPKAKYTLLVKKGLFEKKENTTKGTELVLQ